MIDKLKTYLKNRIVYLTKNRKINTSKYATYSTQIKDVETEKREQLKIGSYVLATKYKDGHPREHWVVGFLKEVWPEGSCQYQTERYDVINNDGQSFRGNGFRKCEVITKEEGEWLLKNGKNFPEGKVITVDSVEFYTFISIWEWLQAFRDN